ncbi:unnamed protein product [Diatraea saccharalis]|uniref:Bromo domain-containing protein n=1 Tax=Diatraea saccharalis TaxID=40085 RepID=A0A9N9R6C7_9NEOP|nr:unnamed protein product [Diatraea saccharalis]
MSSIQERLQLKRVPLDTWNIREQLCLASAVVRSGDQNWMSVSRALKTVGEPNRPPDWYSQKSCAAQYGALLEHVETPKRKKRSSEGAVETPQESILKRLTQERIVEIQKTLAEMNQQYSQLKTEITEVRNPSTSDERLKELWASIEANKRAKERENARRAAWLKEREERRARADRTWRPPQPTTPTAPATPTTPSSPLLTSLLKSSPVVTTPQHISHPANVVETISPSATAPTLSMLLEKSAPSGATQHESKHAAIEHIKSQLVQIEQQLIASTSASPVAPVPLPPAAPAIDIDDIEIKAEDVYAFKDIDIHIPPVTTMHKPTNRVLEKSPYKKDEIETSTIDESPEIVQETIKEEPMAIEDIPEEVQPTPLETQVPEVEETTVEVEVPSPPPPPQPEPEVKISFPEVKFPTPEIKVIQPDEHKQIKEEVKEPEVVIPEQEIAEVVPEEVTIEEVPQVAAVEEENTEQPNETLVEVSTEAVEEEAPAEVVVGETDSPSPPTRPPTPPVEPEPEPEPEIKQEEQPVEDEEPPIAEEPVVPPPLEPEVIKEEAIEPQPEEEQPSTEEIVTEVKREEDAEDSIPLKEITKETPPSQAPKPREEDSHTETDDDTPMELSREEEKDGKKKRDYSRKKKSNSRTWSGSESAPESPSASDAEREHRLWKKSVMLVYSRLCAHKYASLFLRPISDEEAPGYSAVIKRPMDLSTIRRNIENGVIRTTAEFQRDVLLMLSNALIYNSSEHSVYSMAKEMHEEAQCQLGMLLAAQAHAGLTAPPPRRKRRRPDSPQQATTPKRH